MVMKDRIDGEEIACPNCNSKEVTNESGFDRIFNCDICSLRFGADDLHYYFDYAGSSLTEKEKALIDDTIEGMIKNSILYGGDLWNERLRVGVFDFSMSNHIERKEYALFKSISLLRECRIKIQTHKLQERKGRDSVFAFFDSLSKEERDAIKFVLRKIMEKPS